MLKLVIWKVREDDIKNRTALEKSSELTLLI